MGQSIPAVSGRELVKLLSNAGIIPIRQTGSHVQLRGIYKGQSRFTTVPIHGKDLPRGLLLQILRDCGMSKEEFVELLK